MKTKILTVAMLICFKAGFAQSDTMWDYDYGETKWRTFGVIYDASNREAGINFSNGYDEMPLIHFEEFPADFVYKVLVFSNFGQDYGFEGSLGWRHPVKRILLTSVNYTDYDYMRRYTKFRKIGISGATHLRFLRSNLILEPAYQNLNGGDNFGLNAGLMKVWCPKICSGASAGYFGDYWTYSLYAHGFVVQDRVALKVSYDRIGECNFLKFGISYTIKRVIFK